MTHTVRTKMRPWEDLEVGDEEYRDLRRQGLLVEEPATPAPARRGGQPVTAEDK